LGGGVQPLQPNLIEENRETAIGEVGRRGGEHISEERGKRVSPLSPTGGRGGVSPLYPT